MKLKKMCEKNDNVGWRKYIFRNVDEVFSGPRISWMESIKCLILGKLILVVKK